MRDDNNEGVIGKRRRTMLAIYLFCSSLSLPLPLSQIPPPVTYLTLSVFSSHFSYFPMVMLIWKCSRNGIPHVVLTFMTVKAVMTPENILIFFFLFSYFLACFIIYYCFFFIFLSFGEIFYRSSA